MVIGTTPAFVGDASGYVQANLFFPNADFDGDTFTNQVEIDAESNPFDLAVTPDMMGGFVAPVLDLMCGADAQTVTLTWTNGGIYDSIEVRRNGMMVMDLGGMEVMFAESVMQDTYLYQIVPMAGGNEAAPVSIAASNNPGRAPAAPAADGPTSAGREQATVGAASPHRTIARAMFSNPAIRIVPGSPAQGIRTKPLASTPTQAPMLLVK